MASSGEGSVTAVPSPGAGTAFVGSRSAAGDTGLSLSRTETVVRRVLRTPVGPPRASDDAANRLFSTSIALSALRCLFTYIFVPVAVPVLGLSVADSPAVGIPLSLLALVFDVRAVRRFWLADHAWKWRMTVLYGLLMAMVSALFVIDIIHAVSL